MANKTTLNAINVTQHKAIKTTYDLPYRTPSVGLYEDYNELDIMSLSIKLHTYARVKP